MMTTQTLLKSNSLHLLAYMFALIQDEDKDEEVREGAQLAAEAIQMLSNSINKKMGKLADSAQDRIKELEEDDG